MWGVFKETFYWEFSSESQVARWDENDWILKDRAETNRRLSWDWRQMRATVEIKIGLLRLSPEWRTWLRVEEYRLDWIELTVEIKRSLDVIGEIKWIACKVAQKGRRTIYCYWSNTGMSRDGAEIWIITERDEQSCLRSSENWNVAKLCIKMNLLSIREIERR